jgi:hypothetical protein
MQKTVEDASELTPSIERIRDTGSCRVVVEILKNAAPKGTAFLV